MSIIYTGLVAIEFGPEISVRSFDAEHGSPSVMVRLEGRSMNFTLHLSPEEAASFSLRLSQAAAIAAKVVA